METSGRVQISIEDLEGLRADPALSFALDAQPDRPPVARLKLSGIGDKITPVATLPPKRTSGKIPVPPPIRPRPSFSGGN